VSVHKEERWDTNKAAVDSGELQGKCIRRFAQNARKNAKSLLSPEMTVRYTAGIVIQSVRTKAVKRRGLIRFFGIKPARRD
jgi:hypothetical protein